MVESTQDAIKLLDDLKSPDGAVRAAAERMLCENGPGVAPWLASLLSPALQTGRQDASARALVHVCIAAAIGAILLVAVAPPAALVLCLVAAIPASALYQRLRDLNGEIEASRQRIAGGASEALMRVDAAAAVDAVASMLPSQAPYYISGKIARALASLLPRLGDEDGPRVGDRRWQRMLSTLQIDNAREHSDYLVALLDAIVRTSHIDAVTAVRSLAEGPATSPEGIYVRERARECLKALIALQKQEEFRRVLLRPSQPPLSVSEALLRPASGAGSDSGQLLRPADSRAESADG